MDDNITLIQEVLALDTIYRLLTWDDRMKLHHSISRNKPLIIGKNKNIGTVMAFIINEGWESPKCVYNDSRLLCYKARNGVKIPIEDYPMNHPEISAKIDKLKGL